MKILYKQPEISNTVELRLSVTSVNHGYARAAASHISRQKLRKYGVASETTKNDGI